MDVKNMPSWKNTQPKKPRTTFKTIVRRLEYEPRGQYRDVITKEDVQNFYPEFKKMLNLADEDFLYTKLTMVIEDPEKQPSNKFENEPRLANIVVYGDSEITVTKKQFDDNGNIVPVINPKTKKPITISVFEPESELYNIMIGKLDKTILSNIKDDKWVEIELSAYKFDEFDPEYPRYKSSYSDLKNLKILGSVPKRKLKLKESWIKANPKEADEYRETRPDYFDKHDFKQPKDFKQKEI